MATPTPTLVAHRTRGSALRRVLDGPVGAYRWQEASVAWPCSGSALCTTDGLVLVDPPSLAEADLAWCLSNAPPPVAIVLTSGAHDRAAATFRERLAVPLWAPDWPAHYTDMPVRDRLVRPGDALPGGLSALAVPAQPPYGKGEVAYLWPAHGGVLLTGDLIPRRGRRFVYWDGLMWPWPVYGAALDAVLEQAGRFRFLFGGHDRPTGYALASASRALSHHRRSPHVRRWPLPLRQEVASESPSVVSLSSYARRQA